MSRRRRLNLLEDDDNAIDLTPMLDIVFIMLIFFIVTTSFIKPSGITVDQPTAVTAEPKQANNILIGLTPQGEVWIGGQPVDLRSVQAMVERMKAASPDAAVIIQADKAAPSGLLVRVMDQVRLAGVENMAIAAQRE